MNYFWITQWFEFPYTLELMGQICLSRNPAIYTVLVSLEGAWCPLQCPEIRGQGRNYSRSTLPATNADITEMLHICKWHAFQQRRYRGSAFGISLLRCTKKLATSFDSAKHWVSFSIGSYDVQCWKQIIMCWLLHLSNRICGVFRTE